jgi:hypothetical protein
MAKTPVTLIVKGLTKEKREVATFKMIFNQATDVEGQVTGLPRGGKITMRVKALNDGNSDLVRWMTDKKLALSGSIIFENTTNGKLMKTLFFEDAYCVSYTESWEDSISSILLAHWEDTTKPGDLAHWEQITITCKEITNQAVTYTNDWS